MLLLLFACAHAFIAVLCFALLCIPLLLLQQLPLDDFIIPRIEAGVWQPFPALLRHRTASEFIYMLPQYNFLHGLVALLSRERWESEQAKIKVKEVKEKSWTQSPQHQQQQQQQRRQQRRPDPLGYLYL